MFNPGVFIELDQPTEWFKLDPVKKTPTERKHS